MGSSRVRSPKSLLTSKGSPASKRYLTPTTTLPLLQKLLSAPLIGNVAEEWSPPSPFIN